MMLTAEQCRAARSLLNWSQDDLATNARVSRATVADFENNARQPMKNNLIALEDCMFSAGVEFLAECDDAGVGVRFRQRRLEYVKNIRVDRISDRSVMNMRYAGEPFKCVIPHKVVDDFHRRHFTTETQYIEAISEMLHVILAAVERQARFAIENGEIVVTYKMLDPQNR